MSLFDEMESDFSEILSEIGKPFEWKGQTFAASMTENALSEQLVVGGFEEKVAFTVKTLRSQFNGDIPVNGDIIAYEGNKYRIHSVTYRKPHALVTFNVTQV